MTVRQCMSEMRAMTHQNDALICANFIDEPSAAALIPEHGDTSRVVYGALKDID